VNNSPGASQGSGGPFAPPVPHTIQEAGLSESLIEQLILKTLYFRGETMGRDLTNLLGLKFSAIEDVVEFLKREHLVLTKRSMGMGNISSVFVLSESGRKITQEYLDTNQYTGHAPVPIDQYAAAVRAQRVREGWITPQMLEKACQHMVLRPEILQQVGPAVSAGQSLLIYGQPGNGKTYLAETLFQITTDPIYVPYALECGGRIVQMFDPIYHHRIEDEVDSSLVLEHTYDARWFRCQRPFVVTGGELTLDMLDLAYNANSKIYDAPLHLKANNGIYVIDDFGRQRATPTEVLNRWIVPMERRIDYLSFSAGGKVTVPFEVFLIFSTNLNPHKLGDEAFLRRIQYKLFLKSPDEFEFCEIFRQFCASRKLACPPDLLERFVEEHYGGVSRPFRRCHPRDVITHAIDLMAFERLPYELTDDLLDRAFASCFLDQQSTED
jgi:predicted ATPase with chaperone activity